MFSFTINDVAILINEVTLVVDPTTNIVDVTAIVTLSEDDSLVTIPVEYAHDILYIKSATVVIEQLWYVTVFKLLSIESLSSFFVYNMHITTLNEPAKFVNSSAFFVNAESLFGLLQLWKSPSCNFLVLEVEVSHQIMGIEVVLFNAEWSWHLTLVINRFFLEHDLRRPIVDDITSLCVQHVASHVGLVAILVDFIAHTVLKNDNISAIISIQLTQNVIHIEVSLLSIRCSLIWICWLSEILD